MWLIYYKISKKLTSNKEKVKLYLTLIPVALFSLLVCANSIYVYIYSTRPSEPYEIEYPFIFFKFIRMQMFDGTLLILLKFVKEDIINSAIICLIIAIAYLSELKKKIKK